ncbi:hypothetical protein F4774DRAFT_400865 [Daldinia eschscholtzii]|nr:hypothetical protein F4774DRAFT_400865 [Daldinia eschscholtzii]
MAEALSIAAAVVQFVDVAIWSSEKLSWVYSEVHGAPERLHDLKVNLDQQIKLVEKISQTQLDVQTTLVDNGDEITAILVKYKDVIQNLLELLQSLLGHTDKNILRKGWGVILTLHKRNDILLCDQIEEQRDLVLLWHSNINLYVGKAYTIHNIANRCIEYVPQRL